MPTQPLAATLNARAREFFPQNGEAYVVARFRASRQRSDLVSTRRGWTSSHEVKDLLAKIAAFNSAMRSAHVVTSSHDVALRPVALRASPWKTRVCVTGARNFYFLLAISNNVMNNTIAAGELRRLFEVHDNLHLDVANMRGPTAHEVRDYYKTHQLSFQFELPIPLHLSTPDSIRRLPEWSWDLPRDRFFADLSVTLAALAVLMSLEVSATDAETLFARVETTLRHGPRVGMGVTPSILRGAFGDQLDAWSRFLSALDPWASSPSTRHFNADHDKLVEKPGTTRARSPPQARCGVDPNAPTKRAKIDAGATADPDALVKSALEVVMNHPAEQQAAQGQPVRPAQPSEPGKPSNPNKPRMPYTNFPDVSLVSPEALHVKNLTEIANLSAKAHLDTDLVPGLCANISSVSALSCVFHPSSPHALSQIWQPMPLAAAR